MKTKTLWLALALLGSGALSACDDRTPMQKAGDDLKDAAHETGQAAKEAGQDAKDAVKDAAHDLKQAGKDIQHDADKPHQ